MFTGLIEEIGTIAHIRRGSASQQMTIRADQVLKGTKIGDSIAVNGVCQTITAIDTRSFTVDTLAVSLQKTTLGSMTSGTAVNLERAMRLSDRIGGHLVQGHVDGTARIKSIRRQGMNTTLTVVVPAPLMKYCVPEGSIALDGVSLTIAQIQGAQLMCSIIPHTWEHVALKYKRPGEQVHCEVDMIARHLERLMQTVHHTGG